MRSERHLLVLQGEGAETGPKELELDASTSGSGPLMKDRLASNSEASSSSTGLHAHSSAARMALFRAQRQCAGSGRRRRLAFRQGKCRHCWQRIMQCLRRGERTAEERTALAASGRLSAIADSKGGKQQPVKDREASSVTERSPALQSHKPKEPATSHFVLGKSGRHQQQEGAGSSGQGETASVEQDLARLALNFCCIIQRLLKRMPDMLPPPCAHWFCMQRRMACYLS